MHFLIACSGCRRQFDVAGLPVGESVRCSCGGLLEVPRPQAHDAAVVRCSSCGGPREEHALACRYCKADFTLHEQDLDTICSRCMARVSGRSRFCHSCGTPVLVRQASALASEVACPACPAGRPLVSRRLGAANVAILECDSCGGLWVDREIFEVLAERARSETLPDLDLRPAVPRTAGAAPVQGPFYRCCIVCRTRMTRRNWGQKSGVILDVCQQHGVWFDLHELEHLLRWMRTGGDRQAQQAAEAERAALRQLAMSGSLRLDTPSGSSSGSLLGILAAGLLGGGMSGWFK